MTTYFYAFSFTLTPFLASVGLTLFLLLGITQFNGSKSSLKSSYKIMILSSLFWLFILFFVFSEYKNRALTLIVRLSPIFFVPVIIVFTNLTKRISYVRLKKSFLFGVCLSVSISLVYAGFRIIVNKDISYLFYYDFGEFLHIHPTYYALFILTGIHFLIDLKEQIKKPYFFLILSLLLLTIVLTQSKMAILLSALYFVYLLWIYRKEKNRIILPLFGTLVVIIAMVLSADNSRYREFLVSFEDEKIGSFQENGVYQRLWLWEQALEQIKSKLLFGYGIGSQKTRYGEEIQKSLLSESVSYSFQRAAIEISKLNLHNQYLQVTYEMGLFGGILFLASIIFMFFDAIRVENYQFLAILSFTAAFLLIENLLDRQMGIYYFSLILSLFYLKEVDEEYKT